MQWAGNKLADEAARLGAELCEGPENQHAFAAKQHVRHKQLWRQIARHLACWPHFNDTVFSKLEVASRPTSVVGIEHSFVSIRSLCVSDDVSQVASVCVCVCVCSVFCFRWK